MIEDTYDIAVSTARHRLEVLHADTICDEDRSRRTVNLAEHCAIRKLLDELHRLHIAVCTQKKHLTALLEEKTRNRKPADARSQPPTARSARLKAGKKPSRKP